ncbi:hypothetical protein PTSG_09453 [Salpingoeca rosetta]|uniref:Uncharacterized protein n=1 Tax=Salpingoeca rosetta (strain ATCC 50818 / BSB-021) TaxID=946362 RepID=F2UMN5_SALR5|nr:uncharacterized protein PTSG_09453 [Salpingoeca rosetta]EGD78384.1 hypothetical protein PTSG_09453 [Salpingoeca rosetta]|eukprot:XP_004989707.1 hypothetical protein PTSG_09453 [Salpingoeca rosetta]
MPRTPRRKYTFTDSAHSVDRCKQLGVGILKKGKTAVREIAKTHGKSVLRHRSQALDTMSKQRRRKCDRLIAKAYTTRNDEVESALALEELHAFCFQVPEGWETMTRKYKFKTRTQQDRAFYLRLQAVAIILYKRFGGCYKTLVESSKTMLRDYDYSKNPRKRKGSRRTSRYPARRGRSTRRSARDEQQHKEEQEELEEHMQMDEDEENGVPDNNSGTAAVPDNASHRISSGLEHGRASDAGHDSDAESVFTFQPISSAPPSPSMAGHSDAESAASTPRRRQSRRSSHTRSTASAADIAGDPLMPVPMNPISATTHTMLHASTSPVDAHMYMDGSDTDSLLLLSEPSSPEFASASDSEAPPAFRAPPEPSPICLMQLNDIVEHIQACQLTLAYTKIALYWDMNEDLTLLDIYLQLLSLCPELHATFEAVAADNAVASSNAKGAPMPYALVLAPCDAQPTPLAHEQAARIASTGIPIHW